MNFDAWLRKVDAFVWRLAGLSVHDLPDCSPLRLWFDDGVTPAATARDAIRRAR